jgi:hypothetical protein
VYTGGEKEDPASSVSHVATTMVIDGREQLVLIFSQFLSLVVIVLLIGYTWSWRLFAWHPLLMTVAVIGFSEGMIAGRFIKTNKRYGIAALLFRPINVLFSEPSS